MSNGTGNDDRRFILPYGFGFRFTRDRGFSFTRRDDDGQTRTVPGRRCFKLPPASRESKSECPKTER